MLKLGNHFVSDKSGSWKALYQDHSNRLRWVSELHDLRTAWFQTYGEGITVAILDSGLDMNHDDFTHKEAVGKLIVEDFTNEKNRRIDRLGHGTHCAGIIGAGNKDTPLSEGFKGLAPEARLLIGKVINGEQEGYIEWLIEALKWAKQEKADIISLSIYAIKDSPQLYQVIHDLLAAGICIICAAGNEGALARNGIGYPARYGGVITIAAHDEHGRPSGFSSSGGELDFMAPGTDIWSTFPVESSILPRIKKKSKYAKMSGTSMAAPFVAGLSALILSSHKFSSKKCDTPIRNNEELKQHLIRIAAHPGFHDHQTGYGPLLPFQLVGGEESRGRFPDLLPALLHQKEGEPAEEIDDRADFHQIKDLQYWKDLLRSPSGQDWADRDPRRVQEEVVAQAERVGWIVNEKQLMPDRNWWQLQTTDLVDCMQSIYKLNPQALPVSKKIKFRNYPSSAGATGWWIERDLFMTCRHALQDKEGDWNWQNKRIIFGFRSEKKGEAIETSFKSNQIFEIRELLAYGDKLEDWAIIRLSRPMQPSTYLHPLTFDPVIKDPKTPIYALGHPLGLPLQLSCDAQIFGLADQQSYLTDLDVFSGSSGSPVFDANTFSVIGIYVRGNPIAIQSGPDGGEYAQMIGPGKEGEQVQFIAPAYTVLQQYLNT